MFPDCPDIFQVSFFFYLISSSRIVLIPLNVDATGNVGTLLLNRNQQVQGLAVETFVQHTTI